MARINPEVEIRYICNVIDKNIDAHKILNDRRLLSENILSQLRNLVEDVAILINNKENGLNNDAHYDNVEISMQYVSRIKKYRYINSFHKFLQSTVSHYTPSEGDAERLMLHYFRYICMIKDTLLNYGIDVLVKIGDFPIYEDTLTKNHYAQICSKIEEVQEKTNKALFPGRFYVEKCRPIYSKGKVYYEITLSKATDYTNKFEKIIMFSKVYIPDNYAIKISYLEKEVNLFSYNSKIKVIDNYMISIRPCEFKNLGKIFGKNYEILDSYNEYINLMLILKEEEKTILDIIMMNNEEYLVYINKIKAGAKNNRITDLLLDIRNVIINNKRGCNILRYFLVKLENAVIKAQLQNDSNNKFEGLFFKKNSIPFDSMPYAMSLFNHNISWYHLNKAIEFKNREHELLARFVKNNSEMNNILYTPVKEVEIFGDIEQLVSIYNQKLLENGISRFGDKDLKLEHDYIYIASYESNAINIINCLKSYNKLPKIDFSSMVNGALMCFKELSEDKIEMLKKVFKNSSIAIIHGPAGTGKTKILEVLTYAFKDYKKLFLSNTSTSVDNLKHRMLVHDFNNSEVKTVASYISNDLNDYDILIIDECSTVSNEDMNDIMKKGTFKLIILSGDVFQIESIKYGNWFSLSRSIFKDKFVYELINTHRTTDSDLIDLWKKIRDDDEQAIGIINKREYSEIISENIFVETCKDEIILCLNYDGLYGINNINRFFQEKNQNKEVKIGVNSFKIGDKIVFNDCHRFKTLYNNLKGTIKEINIDEANDCTWFTILVNKPLLGLDEYEVLERDNNTTLIKFSVENFKDYDSEANEENNKNVIPFNLAYAMSIHKAQGLEYDSVKIIITSSVEDMITKNIFYTAITRSKKYLNIFWSPESQKKVFENMKKRNNSKDISILKNKIIS